MKKWEDPRKRSFIKKVWHFIWKDDSILSWIVNIILAFVLVKFLIYPGLGLVLGTTHPVVAVVSGSMEHDGDFEEFWSEFGEWYEDNGITKEEFLGYDFVDGFNRGDIMVLVGSDEIDVGDVIVFNGNSNNPIIHRVVVENEESYQTKGDHNRDSSSSLGETDIQEENIVGKAKFRVPYLGWFKIGFASLL
tara:strand:- start:2179 stop:2751 length:573 start_codon:yes stop_codon:yes gene_type:complete